MDSEYEETWKEQGRSLPGSRGSGGHSHSLIPEYSGGKRSKRQQAQVA